MKKKHCPDYEKWSDKSDLLNMSECFWAIPQANYTCSCVDNDRYNSPCLYQYATPPDRKHQ